MKLHTPALPANLKDTLKYPSSIAIQFGTLDAFNDAVTLYSALLNEKVDDGGTGTELQVGQTGIIFKKGMQLLLLEPNTTGQKNDSTVIYWEVNRDLGHVNDELIHLPGYSQVIPPTEQQSRRGYRATEQRSLLEDGSGNQFGLLMNPNFPKFLEPSFLPIPKRLLHELKPVAALLGVLGVGLVLPLLLRKLFK